MLALAYDRYGTADVLSVRELPTPAPRAGEVLVRVRAAALNPKDVFVRQGRFRLLSGSRFPKVVGLDVAGEVAELGRGVGGLAEGDRVFGGVNDWSARRGTVAEYVAIPARQLAAVPPACSFEQAATMPIAASTALQALRDLARVRPGDRVCIHGGAGGVGTFAIQLAKALGAHVTSTSGAASRALCLALGADEALDYAATDAFSGERRYRVVFDVHGNRSLARVRRALEASGDYVTTVPSRRAFADAALTFARRPRSRLVVVRLRAADLSDLARRVEAGLLRPVIDRVVGLADAVEGVRHLESRHAHGKVVVRVA
jgi:NADPH:quinone reductase-like Zn-dependent oxidoreductase